jgi:hypothetical protein
MSKNQTKEREISETHYLVIDCMPGMLRPDNILKTVVVDNDPDFEEDDALMYDDSISFDDFTLVSSSFGEWKFAVFKDKELLFELNQPKIVDHLTNLYKCGQIRYVEWSPK